MDNEKTTKKSKLWLLIILAIVVIAIVVGGYLYYKSSKTKNVFISQINKVIENSNSKNIKTQDKINTTISLSGNIEAQNEQAKQIAQLLNDSKLTLNVQGDFKAKKLLFGLDVDYQNQDLIKGNVYYAQGDNNIYFYVQDLLDKYFRLDINKAVTDENQRKKLQEMSMGNVLFENKEKLNKVIGIITKEIENNLEDKYFEKTNVDGMSKNTLKLNVKELKTIMTNVAKNLENNKEFLNCFKNQNEIIKAQEDLIKGLNEETKYDNSEIEVSIYTTGVLTKETKKVEIMVKVSETEKATFTINKAENNSYEFNLSVNMKQNNMPVSVEALKGTIKVEKIDNNTKRATIAIDNIPEIGKVNINIETKNEDTTSLDSINVANSVDVMNLTQQDQAIIYSNFTKMRIYSLLAPMLMGVMY